MITFAKNKVIYSASALHGSDCGRVAGKTRQLLDNASNTFIMGEYRCGLYTGRYRIKNPRIVFANWGVYSGDKSPPNDVYVRAALEVDNCYVPLLFSGSQVGTISPGANLASDALPYDLPRDKQIYVRFAYQAPDVDGWFYDGSGPASPYTSRDINNSQIYSTGIIGKLAGDSYLNYYGNSPIAVIGDLPSDAISVGVYGDSIAAGEYDNSAVINSDNGFIKKGLRDCAGGFIPCSNYARSFEYLQAFYDSRGDMRRTTTQYHTHNIMQLGTNDLGGSFSLATMQAWYLKSWEDLRAQGQHVAQCKIFQRTKDGLTQNYYNNNFVPNGVKDKLNDWFDSQVGVNIDSVIDAPSLLQDPTDHCKWLLVDGALPCDGTHPNGVGVTICKAAVTEWGNNILAGYL